MIVSSYFQTRMLALRIKWRAASSCVLPVCTTAGASDLHNSWKGKVKIMWGVDQVKTIDGTDSVAFGFTKIGTYVQNAPQELWFLRSDNLLTEKNASKVTWKLLPEGDHGILPPGVKSGPPIDMVGDVFEEAHIVPLAMGGFYAVGRTTQGFLGSVRS